LELGSTPRAVKMILLAAKGIGVNEHAAETDRRRVKEA